MLKNLPTFIFGLLVTVALIIGWIQRDEYWITAEYGLGYSLGIIGGIMMLVLLLYPLRKHWKVARNWFKVQHWFQMHMILGVLGPVLIMFHSNFRFGSLNSNIALICMLLVAGSGLVGRYVYQKIHRGLYGKQIEFSELREDFEQSKAHFSESELFDAKLEQNLTKIETQLNKRKVKLFTGISSLRQIKSIQSKTRQRSRKQIKQLKKAKSDDLINFSKASESLQIGLTQLRAMANYAVYAKLFSLWHVIHLPIFFMMIITGIVHVIAVHMY